MEPTELQNALSPSAQFLRERLLSYLEAHPQISMRSLTTRARISRSLLSLILRGQRALTRETAMKFANTIKMPEDQREALLTLVDYERVRDANMRTEIATKIDRFQVLKQRLTMSEEQLKLISDWYLSAILECFEINPKLTVRGLAKHLRISEIVAQDAVSRLIKAGLIRRTPQGHLRNQTAVMAGGVGTNLAIRKYHKQILKQAFKSIERVPTNERYFTGVSIAIDDSLSEELFSRVEKFKESLILWIANSSRILNSVYQLEFVAFPHAQRVGAKILPRAGPDSLPESPRKNQNRRHLINVGDENEIE